MKLLAFTLGVLTGLAFSRIPHLGPLFHDQPETPADHQPKYAIGGRYVTREQFEAHEPNGDPDVTDGLARSAYRRYRAGEITRKEWSDSLFAAHPEWSTPA